jgi:hypothetical protein
MEAIGCLVQLVYREADGHGTPRQVHALTIAHTWLSLHRNRSTFDNMFTLTCSCPTSRAQAGLHRIGSCRVAHIARSPSEVLLVDCYWKLRGQLDESKNISEYYLNELGSRSKWPQNTQQLFPHGPEATVGGLLYYCNGDDIFTASRLLEVLITVMMYGWPIVAPVMAKKRLLPQTFTAMAYRWSNHLSTLPEEHVSGIHINVLRTFLQLSAALSIVFVDASDPTAATYFLQPTHEQIIKDCDTCYLRPPGSVSGLVLTPKFNTSVGKSNSF